jgi:hypothetical protein
MSTSVRVIVVEHLVNNTFVVNAHEKFAKKSC